MTRRDPRGAENWGAEREKMARSSVGVVEVKQWRKNATADLGFFPFIMHPFLSLCQVLTVTQPASAVPN